MTMEPQEPLTPQAAARTLAELQDLEQALSNKAGALSWMLFGLGGAAIFATYGMVGPWFEELDMPWLYMFLWMPWIAAATIGTTSLWRMMNLSLARPEDDDLAHGWLYTFGYSLLFLALGATAWYVIGPVMGYTLSTHIIMTLTVGVFTAILATFQARHYCAPVIRTPFTLAGLALVALGITMAALDLSDIAAGLFATFGDLTAYFVAGVYVFRRG